MVRDKKKKNFELARTSNKFRIDLRNNSGNSISSITKKMYFFL